ncbi:MAG: NADP-dependent oxidoreductase [Candidatus Eremiobacteraeota bacterium]|nr:NADP-dependent oxidoreductase [Candidatus Eremiobacteraeota bacterium]
MKAIVVHEFGPPPVLRYEDVPAPAPASGEVTVSVEAAGVGAWDALVREGKSGLGQDLPLIPGADLAGTVFSVGTDAGEFRVGDSVYGATNPSFTGAYAEVALCKAAMLARKPANLDFLEAASVPVVGVTAWQMLFEYAKVEPGQTVLVHGAGGNVGSYGVQLANHAGARVIASGSAGDRDYVLGLGAERFLDFRAEPFDRAVHDVDVVLDTVGGEVLSRSFDVVRRGGVVVSAVAQPREEDTRRSGARGVYFIVDVTKDRLDKLTDLFESGALKTRIGEMLPLERAQEAHEMLAGAPHRPGRIVLQVRSRHGKASHRPEHSER